MSAVPLALPVQADAWLLAHVGADVDALTGIDFERCVGAMFNRLGYEVEFTETYDFGADLIVSRDGNRTAVQAKRQDARVGEHAFQQVLEGRIHYHCDSATVVTNSELMSRARKVAVECGVSVLERTHRLGCSRWPRCWRARGCSTRPCARSVRSHSCVGVAGTVPSGAARTSPRAVMSGRSFGTR